jgi:NAD(P) transhydrogenase subunit alpha
MYAKNITTFVQHLTQDGRIQVDPADEITRETLLTQGGEVVHPRLRQAMGLGELVAPSA